MNQKTQGIETLHHSCMKVKPTQNSNDNGYERNSCISEIIQKKKKDSPPKKLLSLSYANLLLHQYIFDYFWMGREQKKKKNTH